MNNQLHIKTLRALTPEEIARKVEEESNKLNGFASPIVQDLKTFQWISFIYYRTLDTQQVKPNMTTEVKINGKELDAIGKVGQEDIPQIVEKIGQTKKPVTQMSSSDGRGVNQSGSSSSGSFNPTSEQLNRWKKTKITKGTYGKLRGLGYSNKDIKEMANMYNAYFAIKNLDKEYI